MTVHYADPGAVNSFFSVRLILGRWKGSIFEIIWIEWTVYMVLAIIVLTAYYLAWRGKSVDDVLPGAAEILGEFSQLLTRFQAAIGLMLGFYARCKWQKVLPKVKSMIWPCSWEVSCVVLELEKKSRKRQQNVARHLYGGSIWRMHLPWENCMRKSPTLSPHWKIFETLD